VGVGSREIVRLWPGIKGVSPPGRALPPPGRAHYTGSHPNCGGRGGTIKRLRRPLLRPPEGGRGPMLYGVVGGDGAQ
jgi:hypothetical protein